ncbi:MAG TPA: creatininase family protein [Gaiellaceae bacterium]|nr:creatininase family protein [Gaiellaceae bacterium]
MEEMTWPEIKEAMEAGRTTALLACGASEQHGPHLPTGTDTYLGSAIAERAARIAGNALVAPTLRPGLSEHHMHFPGSFSLRIETFVALLEDYCESLARQGFERIVLFPSHGGNSDVMRAYGPTLARAQRGRCEVIVRAGADFQKMFDLLAGRGVGMGAAGVHAGYAETSEMLECQPHLVHMDRAVPGRCDEDFYKPENIGRSQMESYLEGIQTQSPTGVLGDPTGATAEAGVEILELLARGVAADATASTEHVALTQPT